MEYRSPFAQRLDTNYVPAPAEFDTINRVIDEQLAFVDAIEAQIAELKRHLRVHTDVISKHRDLLTPARRIPPDILSAIFFTLATLPDRGYSRKKHPMVTVTHVCHLWRTLAIDNPLLWANIDVHVPLYPHERDDRKPGEQERLVAQWNREMDGLYLRVQAFAHRAKGCGINVSYSAEDAPPEIVLRSWVNPADDGGWGKTLHPFERLAAATTKWRSISVKLWLSTYASPLLKVLALVKGVTSHVRDLSIKITCGVPLEVDDTFWKRALPGGVMNIYSAPLASFTAKLAYGDLCRVQPNWDAISRLSIGSPHHTIAFGPQEAVNVLSVTPNIAHCTIQFSDSAMETQFVPQSQAISLPKLQSFTMRGTEVPIEFAALLDLPSLTHLSAIQSPVLPQKDENHSAVVDLIRRYGQRLTDVAFVFTSITPSALGPILDNLPNVASLELVGDDPNPGTPKFNPNPGQAQPPVRGASLDTLLLQRLTPNGNGGEPHSKWVCLCPKLRKLSVSRLGAAERDQDMEIKRHIVNLISSRRREFSYAKEGEASWLEVVTVAFNGGPIDWMTEELQAGGVGIEGVKFSAKYSNSNTVPTSFRLNPGYGPLNLSSSIEASSGHGLSSSLELLPS